MFERRRVKDDLRPALLEDLRDPARVADVRQHRIVRVEQRPAMQRQLHGMQGGLVTVQHDQFRWMELVQLPAEFGADGSARTSDQNPLAREMSGDSGDIRLDRPASEQVADPRVTNSFDTRAAVEHLRDRSCRDNRGRRPRRWRPPRPGRRCGHRCTSR